MLCRMPIVYKRKVEMVSRWGEAEGGDFEDFPLLGLYVESKNQTDSVKELKNGSYDEGDGYVVFGFDALNTANLIVNGLPALNPNTDYLEFQGKRYEVIGVHPLGQLVNTYTVVKVTVRKIMEAL